VAEQSGQTTVTTAGTEVLLHSDLPVSGPVMVKALPGNTGIMYVGNVNGAVSSSLGMPLSAGDAMIYDFVGNLNSIWVDASVSGEKVAWALLSV
jgi:hypothetical protein